MKSLIYQDDNLMIYRKKGEFMVGEEADIADDLLEIAFAFYLGFARHLVSPSSFWLHAKANIESRITVLERYIGELKS